MLLAIVVKSFIFDGLTEQAAYIKGCKQLAKYMASKKHKNLTFKIERVRGFENRFTFTLYTNIDITSEKQHFCKMCRELNSAFYINNGYSCTGCKLKNFFSVVSSKGKISKRYYKSIIK